MSATFDRLLALVSGYVSDIHARSIVRRAFESCGVVGREPEDRDLPRVLSRVERSLQLFLSGDSQARLRVEIQALLPADVGRRDSEVIDIADEGDIVTARSRARELCVERGADRMSTQKAATIVSELARNIVSYTPGGYLELSWRASPNRLGIKAVDKGRGIGNLEEILAGRYRSRTGLGMGLAGTRRLATAFDVKTGPSGTTVEVWVAL